MVWLRAPEIVEDVLWEGMLEPETEEAVERTRRELDTQRDQEDLQEYLRNLPTVSIGRPGVWSLSELYPPKKMPHLLKARSEEVDFYLVRTVCSFRPMREAISLSWARFMVRLLPDPNEQQLIAYDLYPKEVYQEVKRHIKVSLSPTVNFQELQAGVGGVEFGLEYPELQPVISASGIGENEVDWNYEAAKGIRLQGSKTMYLLVEAPKGMPSAWASLDLVADVLVRNSLLPTLMPRSGRQEAADPMKVQLW
jgi:hypothetical protein